MASPFERGDAAGEWAAEPLSLDSGLGVAWYFDEVREAMAKSQLCDGSRWQMRQYV